METVLLQTETISKSCSGDQPKQNHCIFQVQTTDELQIWVGRLEQELAASTSLAAERLEEIIKLKSSLASVTNELETFMVESLKSTKEISSLRSYVKSLKKKLHKMDDSRTWAEVEVLRTQLAAWSHLSGSQAMRILQLEREIHSLLCGGWEQNTKSMSERHSNKNHDGPALPRLTTESILSHNIAMAGGPAPMMQPITWLQKGQSCNAVGIEVTSPSSCLNVKPQVDDETAAVEVYFSSQKEDKIPVDARFLVGESSGGTIQKTSTSNPAIVITRDCLTTCFNNASTKGGKIGVTPDKLIHFYKGSVSEVDVICNNQDVNVKVENSEDFIADRQQNSVNSDVREVRVKEEIIDDNAVYDLDHVPLQERITVLVSKRLSDLDDARNMNCLNHTINCTLEYDPDLQQEKTITCLPETVARGSASECSPADSTNAEPCALPTLKQDDIFMDSEEKTQVAYPLECDTKCPLGSKPSGLSGRKKRKTHTMGLGGAGFEAFGSGGDDIYRGNVAARSSARRRRKKTVVDSVETALEEDAPGLLQILLDKGIKAGEIKLYGDKEDEDALEISNNSEFSELETIVSKLFSQSSTLLKFPPLRQTKGSKASYCLSCLISLVEQTQYLQFRKWPVEWGWCRELRSFIFVFKRHNRIVLERPEYGYATYFFELVGSVPIDWQIRRLITTLKLSNCGRITLIENKPLQVGEDLTEGEARILEEYGWRPNGGLGTMLNYCDRVVHDRKSEGDSLEWKSKIGKLLMEGYDGGTVVMAKLPRNLIKYMGNPETQMKIDIPETELKIESNPESQIKAEHTEKQVKMEL
ncbi:uncharacterized protein [Aristolochia californica]|uniref:uncharacterized protein isoform X2 n=1 Tax=Aristolochia californica TaxID=171875 RepID=UPI0035DC494B